MMKLMKKTGKNRNRGFTLVELIVVLVILGILAAIMVPALLGWIDKAREKKYLLEARNVVLATQTVATEEYAAGKFTGNATLFVNEHEEEIFNIADIAQGDSNAIREMEFQEKDGKRVAIVKRLVYRTVDNMIIVYDVEGSPVYQIGEEIGAPSYRENWLDVIKNLPHTKKNTVEMRKAVKEANNGTFPNLTASEQKMLMDKTEFKMANGTPIDSLTWKPIALKNAEDGFAVIANANDTSTNATVVFYNGSYYICLNKHNSQGYVFDNTHIKENMDVSVFDNAKDISYYQEHLDDVTGKVWAKL